MMEPGSLKSVHPRMFDSFVPNLKSWGLPHTRATLKHFMGDCVDEAVLQVLR